MEKPTYDELVMGERKFLHDIANYLVVAQGMASLVQKNISKPDEASGQYLVSDKDRERFTKVIDSISKITEALKARRSILHSVSEDKKN